MILDCKIGKKEINIYRKKVSKLTRRLRNVKIVNMEIVKIEIQNDLHDTVLRKIKGYF